MPRKTAILLGATGLTGGSLLNLLLKDERYEKVILFSRRSVKIQHQKIEEHIIDLFQLENYAEKFRADEVFCCIGSTQKKTPNNEAYKKVDVGIPSDAAKLAKEKDIKTFLVISALGADMDSRFFYNQIKGKMEANVLEQHIEHTYILRPSLISGQRKEKRPFEFLWKQVMKVANFMLLGPLKKYRSISPPTIAKAMMVLANTKPTVQIIESEKIKEITKKDFNF